MPADNPFSLTDVQKERLLASRAAWEEGEGEESLERLRLREEDRETLRALSLLLEETRLAQGGELTYAQLLRLLHLVRALAPNPNLDARLLRQPDEPAALNADLRELWFGAASAPLRLRGFLARRHAGAQTALQLLCAVFPEEWPLVTRAGLRFLDLTPEQLAAAVTEARRRYELPAPKDMGEQSSGLPDSDPIVRLLGEVVVYAAAREALEASDYVEVHRLLTQGGVRRPAWLRRVWPLAAGQPPRYEEIVRVRETPPAAYEPASLPAAPDITDVSEQDVLAALEESIAAQGFTYPPFIVRDYYIALQTKPFALLSGLSGTGKTLLTSLFAAALTAEETQYLLLPVRPDWTDSAPLLGYVNLLAGGGEGRFVSTPFLDFLRLAERPENAWRAFFLCLDEMNLARVEHYFAEILSAMETPKRELILPDGRLLRLPANLFFTGTLNLDEATYALSRKVFDRANVLSFREVSLREEAPQTVHSSPTPDTRYPMPAQRQAVFLRQRVTSVADAREKLRRVSPERADFAALVVNSLADVNALLESSGLQFGYRVRDEVLRYCANSFDRTGQGLLTPNAEANLHIALDLQLQQKVLPRFAGTREQMEPALRELRDWTEKAGLPQTTQRLARLLNRLQRDGFAAFDEF